MVIIYHFNMCSSLLCLLCAFLLAGCESHVVDAKLEQPKVEAPVHEAKKTDEQAIVYKIEAIKGPHSPKVQRHLFGLIRSCQEGLPVVIEYTIAHTPLILKANKDNVFDNLIVRLSVKYRGRVERAILNYQHCYADRWEYDDMLYHMIAQKIAMMLLIIEKKAQQMASASDSIKSKSEV